MAVMWPFGKRDEATATELRALRQDLRALRHDVVMLREVIEQVRGGQKVLRDLAAGQKNDGKWRSIFRRQLGALVRLQYLATRVPAPEALLARRFRLRSQNEEDGIVLALLDAVGVTRRRFVEIGSGGTGGNSAVLAYDMGWSGMMIEASARGAAVARELFRHNPGVTVLQKFATADNVNSLLRHATDDDPEVDLMSIDVDSVDYWLLDALNTKVCRPRVLVLEYNAHFGPTRAVTVPNGPVPAHAPKSYFGASLAALTRAARRKGYRLVACEPSGINAFFVRKDLAPELSTLKPAQAYRPMVRRIASDEDIPYVEDVYALAAARGLPIVDLDAETPPVPTPTPA